jgi:hypothetical protein
MGAMFRPLAYLFVAGVVPVVFAVPALAQEPESAAPAGALSRLLTEKKMDSIAVRLPGKEDEYAGALSFPGQLIVVWARFSAPPVLNEKLLKGEFREVYIDLNSASIPESRHFVTDIGADGVRRGERDQAADSHDVGTATMRFDANWRAQKLSEEEYMKRLAEADKVYTSVLNALIEGLKKVS